MALTVALVTTSAPQSEVDRYARELLPHLREHAEVDVFVEPDAEPGADERPVGELDPSRYDRLLYHVANDRRHGFMIPLVRAHGGTVVLHDWFLNEAVAGSGTAWDAGGWRGTWLSLREGGLAAARDYRRTPAGPIARPLNRSIVRLADSFVVHASWLRECILAERNAATPIAVVHEAGAGEGPDFGASTARALLAAGAPWAELAARYHECLELFPSHRANRQSFIRAAIEASDRQRAERAAADDSKR